MVWYDFIFELPNTSQGVSAIIYASIFWFVIVLIIAIVWIATARRKKGVDVSALAALASSEPMSEGAAASADPREVMTILSIERLAASTALSAVKDARRSKRISSTVSDSLSSRYKARITKIDADLKRRSGAQEYQSLAESLESSRDRLRDQVMPPPVTPPPPPTSSTPGIPPTAPPVPGSAPPTGPPKSGAPPSVPTIPSIPTGSPPTKPSSPIPIPPKIPPVSTTARPTTVVPPSVAPPTISTPPLPPRLPTQTPVAPPTTSDMAPPPVPTSAPSTPAAPSTDSDGQTISGLRMEMLRELARLKKFMSEETQ